MNRQMYLDFKQKNNCMYFFQHILHLKCYKLICILSLPAISICREENVSTMFTKFVNPVLMKKVILLRTTHTITLRWPFLCGHSSTITYNQRIMSTCQIIMSNRQIFLSICHLFTCWKIQHRNVCAFSVVIIFFSQVDIGIWHVNMII